MAGGSFPQRNTWIVRWLGLALAGAACAVLGPAFIGNLRPAPGQWTDFFQDWASARNWLHGLPVYGDLRIAAHRYLTHGADVDLGEISGVTETIRVNVHPPPSVLLAIPFAGLDYTDAVLAWNLLSLAALAVSLLLVVRQLAIRLTVWSFFPVVALLLVCGPLWKQLRLGQFNLVLLLLLIGCWAADRSGRLRLFGTPTLAWVWHPGVLLGTATAIKLFPGFLVLYFMVRRQWSVVLTAAVSFIVLSSVTAALLGPDAYRDYVRESLPELRQFRTAWNNASLVGFWHKLFDPNEGAQPFLRVQPLFRSPILASMGALASCAAVIAVLIKRVGRARSQNERDRGFALAVTAMLLVSPLTWDHYFLLLLLPLVMMMREMPRSWSFRAMLVLSALGLWIPPLPVFEAAIPGGLASGLPTPAHTLTVLSYQCYALLALFILGVVEFQRMLKVEGP